MQAPKDIPYGVINWAKPDTAKPAQLVEVCGNVGRNWLDL